MEKYSCKLCFRRFANGRALGGHMRSHFAAAAAKIHQSSPSASSTYEDEEFETGYGLRESRRCYRSKRHSVEPESSVSEASPEEDVAVSLMMLSRDTRKLEFEEEFEEARPKKKNKYQCKSCKKAFGSYQALGGHRASHKKFNTCFPEVRIREPDSAGANADKVNHACPICYRVFASGQALGGHKRSHLAPPRNRFIIDLNLPAEEEADQLSAVSDELDWAQTGN